MAEQRVRLTKPHRRSKPYSRNSSAGPYRGNARSAEKRGDGALAGQMYKELAQYLTPKRRATELSGEIGLPFDDAVK